MPVAGLLLFCQRMEPRFFRRDLAVRMQLVQTQITRIRQATNMLRKNTSAVLEQVKIMLAALAKGGSQDHVPLLVHNQLRFLDVALLFAAVVPPLLF